MEKNVVGFTLEIMTAAGTFSAGIAALIGLFKVIKNVTYRDETLYGEEAVERFRNIEDMLQQERLLGRYPFAGGAASIIPQLKITRLRYNPQTMPAAYKGYTQTLRYITHNEAGERIEKVWLLKERPMRRGSLGVSR